MCDTASQSVAVGFFDGVHLGHRAILEGADVALTFRNHPLTVLAPERAPRLVMSLSSRLEALYSTGVKEVVALKFTPALAAMPPEDFLRTYLAPFKTIRCGANWRFGQGGAGDAFLARSLGWNVEICGCRKHDSQRISSTRIRTAIESGAIREANAMLGQPWFINGRVCAGKGLGRQIGFPTVNVKAFDLELLIRRGVYAVDVAGCRAVANWGCAPTMRERAWSANTLEIHFLEDGFPADQTLKVSFLDFIRDEICFPSLDALKAQIARDVKAVENL